MRNPLFFAKRVFYRVAKNKWLAALRPEYWLVSIIPLVIGVALSVTNFSELFKIDIILKVFFACLIVGPLVPGASYLINQHFDRKSDSEAERTKFLPITTGMLRTESIILYYLFLTTVALITAYFLGKLFFFFTIIGIALGIVYSVPPVRIKKIPILDAVLNGFAFGMLPIVGGWTLLGNAISSYILLVTIPIVLCISAGHIILAIPDYSVDKKYGQLTTAVFFGKLRASLLSFFLMVACGILILYYGIVGILPMAVLISLVPGGMAAAMYPTFRHGIKQKWSLREMRPYFRKAALLLNSAALLYIGAILIG